MMRGPVRGGSAVGGESSEAGIGGEESSVTVGDY